jgi:hypothetical protein
LELVYIDVHLEKLKPLQREELSKRLERRETSLRVSSIFHVIQGEFQNKT